MTEQFAQVILDIPTRSLAEPFSYLVPAALEQQLTVGCAVLVEFAHRPALGYVVALAEQPDLDRPVDQFKAIQAVLSTAYFQARQYQLARWLAREYLTPLSETIRLFTPPGASPRLQRDAAGQWQLQNAVVGPVDERWVRLTEAGRAYLPPARATKQRAILQALQLGELRVTELALAVEQPAASLQSLARQGFLTLENRRQLRGQRPELPPATDIQTLTAGQSAALAAIRSALLSHSAGEPPEEGMAAGAEPGQPLADQPADQPLEGTADPETPPAPQVFLLDGITGSGKTEVYLQAIRTVLEQGGTAIVLVPEISLTPQTVARFRSRFGQQVAVLHSRLSAGERYDQWDLLRSGQARVAVGARSALFAPLQDLRLIIIDEEHESSYKQGSAPRYVTRDVARELARQSGAVLVLGSATPSLEVLDACERGEIQHLRLPERPNGRPLPPIQVVDLTQEFQAGNKTMFSEPLRRALLAAMERREKAVLLLNRRGFASFLLCRDCGFVPMCPNCSTSLTFHEQPPRLICHHCGAEQAAPARCPQCGSPYIRQLGPGTQYALQQLEELLPAGTPLVRMDADSTRGRYGHEQRLEEFIAADHGVLLGTQMIAKGLDFPEVTLVGVLIADTALQLPDFRAAERTYQLLEQVAGRAGRAEKDGLVIVQTYWPEHLAIQAAAQHRRELLLAEERRLRRQFRYPPSSRLANILLWSADPDLVSRAAAELAEQLRAGLPADFELLGPSPCVISRRQGQYRWHLLLKAPRTSDLPGWLAEQLSALRSIPGLTRAVDVDPYDMM